MFHIDINALAKTCTILNVNNVNMNGRLSLPAGYEFWFAKGNNFFFGKRPLRKTKIYYKQIHILDYLMLYNQFMQNHK